MTDKANPLALYHQRQIENQATPVHLIGSDPLNIQTDTVIIEQGGATEVTLEAVEARLEAVESLLSGTLTMQLSGSNAVENASESVTVSTTAVGLTTVPEGVRGALITVEEGVRFWTDGSTPTASAGHLAADGAIIALESGDEVVNFQAVRSGSNDATLQVTYY